ncbi:BadF/BadG/BcrA/BcrD ATPase family protein [Streptomyces canus]|uniref:N-acetylglucosamine kinase n=1 Tax=Streptomyces canus TaxID=58343 RepID=UPI0033F67E3D
MTAHPLLVGIDIGGTKTHVRAVHADHPHAVITDRVLPSQGWAVPPHDAAARWLSNQLTQVLGPAFPDFVRGLAVGAHGCEDTQDCRRLQAELRRHLPTAVRVVNDAELIIPAAGLRRGVGIVVGTGAIAVATDLDKPDPPLRAGGWGWVLSDDGSASALVREAARAVLARADRGDRPDALTRRLVAVVGASGTADLAHKLSWNDGPEHWGRYARAVTGAAAEGCIDAHIVLTEGARRIAQLAVLLARRGADAAHVVLAGGLVNNVSAYADAIVKQVGQSLPDSEITVLAEPPVAGAVNLALSMTV